MSVKRPMRQEFCWQQLKSLWESFAVKHTFSAGDIVRWKDELRNRMGDGPFVVVEVLDTPRTDGERDSGSPDFCEPLDILLGSIDSDGGFVVYHYDSRRFEPAE